jgi:hypothetical protein
MRRGSFMLALAGLLLSTASLAAEPSFCASVCDSERRACRADVQQLAAEDGEGLLNMAERNQIARTAAKTQTPSSATLAGERASLQTRRIQRIGACEQTYLRCARACKVPEVASPGRDVRAKNG